MSSDESESHLTQELNHEFEDAVKTIYADVERLCHEHYVAPLPPAGKVGPRQALLDQVRTHVRRALKPLAEIARRYPRSSPLNQGLNRALDSAFRQISADSSELNRLVPVLCESWGPPNSRASFDEQLKQIVVQEWDKLFSAPAASGVAFVSKSDSLDEIERIVSPSVAASIKRQILITERTLGRGSARDRESEPKLQNESPSASSSSPTSSSGLVKFSDAISIHRVGQTKQHTEAPKAESELVDQIAERRRLWHKAERGLDLSYAEAGKMYQLGRTALQDRVGKTLTKAKRGFISSTSIKANPPGFVDKKPA